MLNDPELRQEAYQYFLEEAPELLNTVERHILALQAESQTFTKRREHAYEIMRATHTLKGNAATLDLQNIKTIAHTFEDLIKGLHNSEVPVTEALKQLLIEAYGCLCLAYDREIKGYKVDEQRLMEHTALIFSQLQTLLGNDFSGMTIPNSSDMGFDYVESVFKSGVSQRIKELGTFLTEKSGQAANPEILMILHSHLEVLSDLGLSLNLPGFSEIAHLGDQALAAAPKHWEAIMSVVLADFEQSEEMIRHGDRQRGGEPSQILLAWAKQGHETGHSAHQELAPKSSPIPAEPTVKTAKLDKLLDTLENVVTHKIAANHEDNHPDSIDSLLDASHLFEAKPNDNASLLSNSGITNQELSKDSVSDLPIVPVPVNQAVEQALQQLETYTSSHHPVSKPPIFPQPSPVEMEYSLSHNFVDPSVDLEHLFDDLDSAQVTNLDRYVVAPEIDMPEHITFSDGSYASHSVNHDPVDILPIVPIDITPVSTNVTQVPDVDTVDLLETFSTSLEDLLSNFNLAEDQSTIDWLSGVFEPSGVTTSSQNNSGTRPAITAAITQDLANGISSGITNEITEQIKAEVIQQVTQQVAQQVTQEVIDQIRSGNGLDADYGLMGDLISDAASHPQPLPGQMLGTTPLSHAVSVNSSNHHNQSAKGNLPAVRVGLEVLERLQHHISEIWVNQHRETNHLGELQQSIWELTNTHQRLRETLKELARIGAKNFSSHGALPAGNPSVNDLLAGQGFSDLLHQALEDMTKLDQSTAILDQATQESQTRLEHQQRMLDHIRDDLVSARMQSLGDVLQRCYYVVDQLCQRYQKSVQLNVYGTDILIDKAVADKLYDPLLHLLRNAFDHGIESPSIRKAAGKQITGTINIIAQQRGGQITLEICDDGQGINYEAVSQKAISLGLATPETINHLSIDELTDLLFEPGFSTAQEVSDLSGRGIGLDVVRVQLQNINGSISVKSLPQQGTSFTLRLPVSLTVARLMLVKAGRLVYALLADAIDRVILPQPNQIQDHGTQKVLQLHSHDSELQIPLINIASVMEYRSAIVHHYDNPLHQQPPHRATQPNLPQLLGEVSRANRLADFSLDPIVMPETGANPSPVILVNYQTQLIGLAVDQVIGDIETLIRPLGHEFTSPSYVYGCCILGNDQSYLVIDGMALLAENYDLDSELGSPPWTTHPKSDANAFNHMRSQRAYLQEPDVLPSPPMPALAAAETSDHQGGNANSNHGSAPRILVVDDSVSQRKVLKSLLEKHGFIVVLAKDGKDAVQKLNQEQGNLSLVICDVEMPRMNGFEFLTYCRQSTVWHALPMVLLTSRTTGKHRNVAMELGAQEYMTKPFSEKNLLNVVQHLLV